MTDDAEPSSGIPLHDLLGLRFDWDSGPSDSAEVHMPVRPEAFGFTQNLHGGALATMIDLACAIAAARSTNFDPNIESLVTTDMHIRYLGSAKTDNVIAHAKVLRAGSKLIVIECHVVDEADHLIAAADFSMMKVPLRKRADPATHHATSSTQL